MVKISKETVEQAKKHYREKAYQQTHFQLATKSILNSSGINPFEQGYYFAFNDQIFSLTSKFGNGIYGKQTVLKTAYVFCANYVTMLGSKFNLAICNKILALYCIPAYTPYLALEFEKAVSLLTSLMLDFEFEKSISLLANFSGEMGFDKAVSLFAHASGEGKIVETRFFNVHAWINDHKLEKTPEVMQSVHTAGTSATLQTGYWACDVGIRHANGSETPIASKIAQVSRNTVGWAYIHAHWNCPETPLVATDAIVIRVYGKIGSGSWVQQGIPFLTEPLNATKLDSANWAIWYNVRINYAVPLYQYLYYHDVYQSADYEDEIDNFSYSWQRTFT